MIGLAGLFPHSSPSLALTPILPPIVVVPIAAATLLVVAAHVITLASPANPMPANRRRLRIGSGVLMMFITVLLAFALSGVDSLPSPACDPEQSRLFLLTWLSIVSLLGIVILLALIDLLFTTRASLQRHLALRRQLRDRLNRELALRHATLPSHASPADPPTRPK